ncbi:Ppx/GppA family phosphatase [Novispirillum itersonii]|uniref:Exopolyphosphatase/guanosine-5'-triphosphate, 3'-diphosphate pyrophosphatase n=1 Tax=Novispirillum itersonii TaxID=189 RepID=A0A7X0DP85_NOVIT|nr:Ppx/GppA family phosphatase [Novispirillum itersonii]MBB6210992.1 exopolyphosphatase/guanosine-5'-triphosphate,3'-diphosphate pyrophosphatase [Novispirillum itersonii]
MTLVSPNHRKPIGVLDIGSNTVRLVVYDGLHRTPLALFNEKATCALGAGLESTGRLNPDGVPMALAAIERFVHLARAMKVERLDVLATAACRDAEDGPAFLQEVERRSGIRIDLLTGEEEARRAAFGVLCSMPDADGIVCDLGGGSLELVMVSGMNIGRFTTVPLGVLRLQENSHGLRQRAQDMMEDRLKSVDFLPEAKGRHLYAVGGSWRTLAQAIIAQLDYPIHVLDNFTLPYAQALKLIGQISRQPARSLEKMKGVSRRRAPQLPLAAQLLEVLLRKAQPESLVFSVYGMREGQFYLSLPDTMRDGDPLLSAATEWARAAGRFPEHGRELMEWMSPLFPDETPHLARLRSAACLLGDIFWDEHPDYRAEQAFLKVLRLPFMGLSHTDRAGLALAVYHRYSAEEDLPLVTKAAALLTPDRTRRVRTIGAALRLGHTISGGAPGLLARTRLERGETTLMLGLPAGDPIYYPELFSKRFERLAAELGLTPKIITV